MPPATRSRFVGRTKTRLTNSVVLHQRELLLEEELQAKNVSILLSPVPIPRFRLQADIL